MSYTVGDLVCDVLERCGVTTAFGIVSVHNIPVLDAIGRRNTIRFVMSRGEMGGGHMADAYARVSGGLGVVITSTGPGAANAVPALVEAAFAGTPLLHLTGQVPSAQLDRLRAPVHEVPGQLEMLRSVSKAAYRVRSPDDVLGTLMRAATDALSAPRGPVSVEIPVDIQRAAIDRPPILDTWRPGVRTQTAPDPAAVAEAAARVARARRPLIWAGAGARACGAPLRRLLGMGFGMVTSWAGRGAVSEDHPLSLGALNGNASPSVQALYRRADLLLVIGSTLRGHETSDGTVPLPRNIVRIDIDPLASDRNYPSAYFVQGDARAALDGILAQLEGRLTVDPGFADDVRETKRRAREEFEATLGPYASFPRQLRAAMPTGSNFVRDITIAHTTWGHRLFELHESDRSVYPVGAAIGPGLPLGIGAALAADGRRTVALVGDGGLAVNLAELWTAAQENVDLTIVVMNDGGYGVIKHIQDYQCAGRRFYGDLRGPDLRGLAALVGIPYFRVAHEASFGDAVGAALATRGPSLVEVDMAAIGEHPPYFPYSQAAARPDHA